MDDCQNYDTGTIEYSTMNIVYVLQFCNDLYTVILHLNLAHSKDYIYVAIKDWHCFEANNITLGQSIKFSCFQLLEACQAIL